MYLINPLTIASVTHETASTAVSSDLQVQEIPSARDLDQDLMRDLTKHGPRPESPCVASGSKKTLLFYVIIDF